MTKKSRYDMPAVQSFVFGGIANPTQRAVLRDSDATYLTARQRELDDFEVQRQAYNTALQDFQTNVYEPYKAESAAYNTAAEKYNTDVYNPYKTQFDAYTKAAEEYNAGPRTAEYAGPAAPTLASEFTMKAPTSPTAFAEKAPALPFEVTDVEAHQKAAAKRAVQDASDRAVAIDVVSDPGRFNFGSMSVSDRFMAEGGEVMASAPAPSGPRLSDAIEDLKKGNKSQAEARMREIVGLPPLRTEAPTPPGPSGPRLSDAIEDLKKGNKSQAEARLREIVGLPPLRTEAPVPPRPVETQPVFRQPNDIGMVPKQPVLAPGVIGPIPGSAASDLKKITAVAPPATGSSIPPPPSGNIVPPVPHPDGNTYGSPGSSDGKWFYTDGKWFPNEKVYGGPAVFPDSSPPVAPSESHQEMMKAIVGLKPNPNNYTMQDVIRVMKSLPGLGDNAQVVPPKSLPGLGDNAQVVPPTGSVAPPVRPPVVIPGIPRGPVRPPPVIAKPGVGKKGAATSPSSYFALTPQTSTGLAPGTAAIGPADMPLYGAKNTMGALGANPNLSPGMLGGQQNAGMFSDRLGNRIYSPTAMPLYGFAKGGDINLQALLAQNAETLSDDTPEDVINTDPLGTAQKMMSDLSSANKANPNVSPTRKAIKQTKSAPAKSSAKSGSAKMQYESLIKGDMGAIGSALPTLQDTDSAQAQMRELARIYQLKAQASQDRARGFSADTFGAPTLGQPTLTKRKLTKKRFKEGGEAKKSEGDVAEPLQSPEEQPVTEESSASRALAAFVSRLKEGAQGYLGLDPGISGSDSYRTGQALSNMPGVGAPAAVAGIFIGKGAKGWNNVSNALAKKATKQGASPEEVWRTTGNFKAPDGQWRQEISDADAQMRESIFQGPANRILSHPELFANYPDLGKIMTSKDPYTTRSVLFSGAAGPDALIRLGTAGGKNENAKGMLHEMQHAIQFKEGFGQGGSKDMAFTDPKAFEILKRIRTNVARPISIDEYAKEAWQSSNVTPEIAAMYQKYLDYHKKSLKTMDIEAQKTAGREYYNRLLGEAEARAVEARKSYTMDERLQLIPSRSYRTNGGRDIIPLDQLIVKRSKGSPEEGELSQEEIDAASRPAVGNPSIARQVAKTRASQAAKSNDVNTLPDPQTYAFIQGMLGEAPDQIGFSSMHPDYDKIMGRGEQGMVTGGVSMIGPAAKALKALTKAGVKTVKPAASAAAGVAQDLSSGTERMAIAQRNAALPVKQGGLGLPANNTAMDRALAMGFDTEVFHGTSKDFLTFNPDKAVFAAELPEIANLYARYTKGDGQRIMPLRIRGQQLTISDMNNGGKTGQFGYNLAKKLNLPEKEIQKLLIPQVRYPNGELIPDVKNLSTTFSDLGEREIINRLPKYGIDRLKVTDMPDMGGTQTQYMIPAGSDNIRSSFAAYDPFRRTAAVAAAMGAAAPDLLAGQEDKTNLRNKAR